MSSYLQPRRRFQDGGANYDPESTFFTADVGGQPPASAPPVVTSPTSTLPAPSAPTPATSPLAPPNAAKQPPPRWLKTLMGAGLGGALASRSAAGAAGGAGLAALLTYLGSKYHWGEQQKPAAAKTTGTTGTTVTTAAKSPLAPEEEPMKKGGKVRTRKMRFQDGGAVPPIAGSMTGLPPSANPMASQMAALQALQGPAGAAGPLVPPGGPPPAGIGGPPPSATPMLPGGPSPQLGAALQAAAGAPPAAPPAGPPSGALQASLGALPAPSTPVIPPAVAQPAASTPAAGLAALRGRRQYAKGGVVKPVGDEQEADSDTFAKKKKSDRQWGKTEGPPEPIAKAKGGKVSAKGKKAPITKRPKFTAKKPAAPLSPYTFEQDEGTAPTVAAPPPPPDAGPPAGPPAMAKGGAVRRNKGGVVIRKAKGGECDKMAAGGVAKVRRGFPNTNKAPGKKAFAKGGRVRGCGIAKKGCTFSGVF